MASYSEGLASSDRASMNSIWFDLDDELSNGVTSKSDRFEQLKKNFGSSSGNMESGKKLKSWTSVSKVSELFDLDSSCTKMFKDRSKLWDFVITDRMIGKGIANAKCPLGREHIQVSDIECDELLTDVSESARRVLDRFSRERTDLGLRNIIIRETIKEGETSPDCSSTSTFSFPVTKKDPEDRSWTRKSSCQGNVTFAESSNASVNSDALSEKSFGRSVSINSEESVCTEKSADSSKVCETLPDGTNTIQLENSESWLSKSATGSTICGKTVNGSSVTEQSEDKTCDRSKRRTSYIEKSMTGSSLQGESILERMVSCDKNGAKTVEKKTFSETYKKAHQSPRVTLNCFNKYGSYPFWQRAPKSEESRMGHCKTVSEKISQLIDEAVHQDGLFTIPLDLETDIDKMTSGFSDLKSTFTARKRKNGRRRLGGIISEAGGSDLSCSKFKELTAENDALLQENSKLQSIIQDVTAVNKRWQKYNNERRLYVQKLLSTIQDLQEQINLISEKSALQSSHKENLCEDLENMKREFQERKTVFEHQIKSHKDDWEAERREKQKVIREKEDLEKRLQELMKEIDFLKNTLFEESPQRAHNLCPTCKTTLDRGAVFPGNEFFPPNTFIPKTEHKALYVPYKKYSSHDDHFSQVVSDGKSQSYYSNISNDSSFNERFSESFSVCKKTSGDTIVVEDENGLRLSITEQYPSKNGQTKSILKKTDKKVMRLTSENKRTGKNRRPSTDDRSSTYELGCETSFNLENQNSSPSPYDVTGARKHGYSIPSSELLKVTTDNRSKSEPSTRSNSSENLKPLRESSSWNNQCPASSELAHPECDPSFPSCMRIDFVNQYDSHLSEKDHF